MNKDFVGNQLAYEAIKRHIEQKEPGPLILYGSSGLGKGVAANAAAAAILGVTVERLRFNSDYYMLDKEEELIKVEDVQLLLDRSSISSVSGRKVFIIRNAENMNDRAQNKLLKLLEDRNKSNQLILTCNRNLLLDTIISRCSIVNFYPLQEKEMEEYLKLQGLEPDGRHLAAYLCSSCPYNWELVQYYYDELKETYRNLIQMKRGEDIFRTLHLLVEKDSKSFYELHSKHLVTALQLLQYVFYHIILLKLNEALPEQLKNELSALNQCYSLTQTYKASIAIEQHKGLSLKKYTKNDFFDLVRSLVA